MLANTPFKNVEDLVAFAKANPGKFKIGTSGANGVGDLTVRIFNKKAGIDTVQVPFESAGEAVMAVLGGHIVAFSGSTTSVFPSVQNKSMKILVITADSRDPSVPDIPTVKERGIDMALNNQIGIGAPKGTPKEILAFLEGAFKKTLEDPAFKPLAGKLSFTIDYLNGADFKRSVQADSDQVKAILGK